MAKSREVTKETIIKRLRARLDRKSRSADPEGDAQLRSQVDPYTRLRARLFASSASSNVQAVDAAALVVLAGDASLPVELREMVALLPPPDSMQIAAAPQHDQFTVPVAPARSSKRPATRSAAGTTAPAPKKPRKSKILIIDDDDNDDDDATYELPLPTDCIRRDIDKIIKVAADDGKTPPRVAYPWVGQRAWYNLQEYPDLYAAHWRFWMRHRATFFLRALYATADASTARRKMKTNANQGRCVFLSLNIITFGYYGFLDRSENGSHDNLLWLGGKAARHSAAAKTYSKPSAKCALDAPTTAQTDLATLYRKERARYNIIIARALDPYRVDEDGYHTIRELLESSQALDPTRPAHLRLSDEALARIIVDVSGGDPPNSSWVGNKLAGVWKLLLSHGRIRDVAEKIVPRSPRASTTPPTEKPFESKEQRDDYSDFADDDDMFTVLPPTPPVVGGYALEHSDDDDQEDDDSEEKQPTAAKSQDQEDYDGLEDQGDVGDRSSGANDPLNDNKKSSADDTDDEGSPKKKDTSSSKEKSTTPSSPPFKIR